MVLKPVGKHKERYLYCIRYDWKKEKRADNVEQFRGNPDTFYAPKDVRKPMGYAFAITLSL